MSRGKPQEARAQRLVSGARRDVPVSPAQAELASGAIDAVLGVADGKADGPFGPTAVLEASATILESIAREFTDEEPLLFVRRIGETRVVALVVNRRREIGDRR